MKIADVIKYEGDNSIFVWKHPVEDFNTKTQLIVHASQEAMFFLNGQALDLFGPGRHTLDTQNIPLLSKIINIPTGGETPFHCEVYFINKVQQLALKWGTDSRVQYVEPNYNFPISIGASGELSLSVNNSRKLLIKLVGTENFLERDRLASFFKAFLMTRVKTYIAQTMKKNSINVFEIDENLELFSDEIRKRLYSDFDEFGISLNHFWVSSIMKPDGEMQYEKFKDLHYRLYADVVEANLQQKLNIIEQQTEAQRTIIESKAKAQKRQIEGYSYQQERGFDIAEEAAKNEGIGEFTNLGVGLGVMSNVGGVVGGFVGSGLNNVLEKSLNQTLKDGVKYCNKCGTEVSVNAQFCGNCANPIIDKEFCKNCGFEFDKPGNYCSNCGFKRG